MGTTPTGTIRKVDGACRIAIPLHERKALGIEPGDLIGISIIGKDLVLRKFRLGCDCCGALDNLVSVGEVSLCPKCIGSFVSGQEAFADGTE
jgi:bifunctional DNA-binding transcriptional regulator/antitoxin component of YhaV-PrlF toxin-antitoxin module